MADLLGSTAQASIFAAIMNGGNKDESPYKGQPGFDETWTALEAEVAKWPPGMDVELDSELEETP